MTIVSNGIIYEISPETIGQLALPDYNYLKVTINEATDNNDILKVKQTLEPRYMFVCTISSDDFKKLRNIDTCYLPRVALTIVDNGILIIACDMLSVSPVDLKNDPNTISLGFSNIYVFKRPNINNTFIK